MQQTSIDGVPVLWEDGPAPLTAVLVFGVGTRHETFRTLGVTHLIEHLAMSVLPRSPVDSNANVDVDGTTFHATGRPELVVDVINRVCAALCDLPLDRIEHEARVLQVEDAMVTHPALATSLVTRYGNAAQGLAGSGGPGIDQITREQVVAHAARYFTRGNAVLALSGAPPEGLRLILPNGPRAPYPTVPHLELPTPGYFTGPEVPVAALTGLAPVTTGAWLGDILVQATTDELRHKLGIAYEIDGLGTRISETESLLVVWSDGLEDKFPIVAETMWRILGRLATDGPKDEELSQTRDSYAEHLDDPRGLVDWLILQAARLLRGQDTHTRADERAVDAAITADDVRDAAKAVRETALLFLRDGNYELPGARYLGDREVPSDRLRGEHVYRRKTMSRTPRDLEIWLGPSGFSLTVHGQTGSATWDDIVGVATADGMRGIITADGRQLPVVGKYFKGGDELLERIDRLAGGRLFASTEDAILS